MGWLNHWPSYTITTHPIDTILGRLLVRRGSAGLTSFYHVCAVITNIFARGG